MLCLTCYRDNRSLCSGVLFLQVQLSAVEAISAACLLPGMQACGAVQNRLCDMYTVHAVCQLLVAPCDEEEPNPENSRQSSRRNRTVPLATKVEQLKTNGKPVNDNLLCLKEWVTLVNGLAAMRHRNKKVGGKQLMDIIKLLSFFLSGKFELTAGSDEKNTAQPCQGSNLGLPIAGFDLNSWICKTCSLGK